MTTADLYVRKTFGVFEINPNKLFQLQQAEVDGHEHSRRFRIENGDSPGEKDEVSLQVYPVNLAQRLL